MNHEENNNQIMAEIAAIQAQIIKLSSRIEEISFSIKKRDFLPSESEYLPIFEFAKRNKIRLLENEAISLGKKAAKLCRENNIKPGRTKHPNPRYQWVNAYPVWILKEVFREGGFL